MCLWRYSHAFCHRLLQAGLSSGEGAGWEGVGSEGGGGEGGGSAGDEGRLDGGCGLRYWVRPSLRMYFG